MDFLPENLQTVLQNPTFTYLQTTAQDHLTSKLSHLRTMVLQPYLIEPLSTFLASYSSSMPDLLSIFLLAVILFVSIKILDYAYRVVMFWVRLAFRLVFWGSILGVGWYVYSVGIENAGRDFGWIWGVVYGFVSDFQEKSKIAAAAYAENTK
ncbi:Nuclear pore assembly and biogenesis protein APQ12 [Penicillium cf. griseofulvum]|uniref:Nuclear pore assembly and biogenesis protein APQ12 n=1 Tax=Penicillium cf. griseofulvum TaxID=2972120 RepID=A0A9W9M1T3_9EURO|nr:Nuclear pore assembly and biogenesis protein APQ12 [Penicillium cf. griseofulvum]KAJ5429634.1 Nuclear pore assembly and biogenesis protein APQ12 [Penicillium cf. griseofulvum]KAJ5436600.1 Nuclear pore assembly and biogenesis protein APQ12 [Penicillium cf. griseofulvum]